MSFRKNRRIRFAVVGKARNALGVCGVGCFTDFWLLAFLGEFCLARSACLAFGFLAYLLARLFWANFALLGWLARLLAVILSVAKNPYFDFMDTSLRSV